MKLFYAPKSISIATLITLEELGTPFEAHRLDIAASEQLSDAYLKVNPKGRVPALVTDQGILTETIAILEFIGASLLPSDRWKAAKVREIMTYLATTMHVNHAHKKRGHRWATEQSSLEDMTAKVPTTMAESAAYVETLLQGPLSQGDELCLADPYLYTVCSWLKGDGVNVEDTPKLALFMETMAKRPSIKRIHEEGLL